MIKLLRIDHRLLHGQVAFAWYGYLGANAILIANNKAASNDLTKASLKLGKPSGSKLIIKTIDDTIKALNDGKADSYELFVVVGNVKDAYEIASQVNRVKTINVGGLVATDKTHPFYGDSNINLTDDDEKMLKELSLMGKDVEFRMVPSEKIKRL